MKPRSGSSPKASIDYREEELMTAEIDARLRAAGRRADPASGERSIDAAEQELVRIIMETQDRHRAELGPLFQKLADIRAAKPRHFIEDGAQFVQLVAPAPSAHERLRGMVETMWPDTAP
jgi:hypothetical protein